MKKVKIEDAVGLTLCHDVTELREGFKGAAFRRGHVITEADIPHFKDLGKRTVFVWEEGIDEVHEEDAARRMAATMPCEGAHYTEPSEGKVSLIPERRGMFRVDTALLRQLNAVPDITISTLPDHYPVEKGHRMASMRIIPLVTDEANIRRVEELCHGRQLFALRPYQERKVGVIITGSELYTGRIEDRFEPVVRQKLAAYPAEILDVTICDDDLDMILDSARRQLQAGADLLIFSGGMSVDPDDLTPTAIRELGAEIISHGVPAQPGNMTLAAYLGDIAILGVPSSAISQPATVFDVLLPQIFTGDKLTREDLIRLGEGGLCQSCEVCHFPNCTFGRY